MEAARAGFLSTERVGSWQEELQRLIADVSCLRPAARRAIGNVLDAVLLEDGVDAAAAALLRAELVVLDRTRPAAADPRFAEAESRGKNRSSGAIRRGVAQPA